jgi:hypothetical protein
VIVPRQYALALVAETPRGDVLRGYVAPVPVLALQVALRPEDAMKWATMGDVVSWLAGRVGELLPWLAEGLRVEPVGLVVAPRTEG